MSGSVARTRLSKVFLGGLLGALMMVQVDPLLATGEFHPAAEQRVIDSPHFRVIFDSVEGAALAPRISVMLEEIRLEVLDALQLPDPGKYDVLVLDNYDYANGSAYGFPIRTIRLYVNGPLPPITGSSDLADSIGETWLRELITHEYTHAVHLNYFTGWTRWYRNLFWSNPFGIIYPSWFVEGLAVAIETDRSVRGRARTTTTDMILRVAALTHTLVPPGLWAGPTAWPRGGARYLYGGAFLHWFHLRYGKGSLQKVLRAANEEVPWLDDLRPGILGELAEELGLSATPASQLRFGGLERAFQRAVGTPLSKLLLEWELEVNRTAFKQQDVLAEAGLTQTRALSFHAGSTRSPAISPDGAFVAFVGGDDNELRGIYVAPLQGGRSELLLARDDLVGEIAFSPNGEQLYYARIPEQDGPLERNVARTDLFALDLRSRTERRLTFGARLRDPAISPDGTYCLAIQTGGGRTRLVRIELDGSLAVELFAPSEHVQLAQPHFSPSGRRVVLSVNVQQDPPGQAGYHLGIYDLETGAFRVLPGSATDREAVWLDEQRLLFSSDRSGVFNLYTAQLASGTITPVTNLVGGAFQPRTWQGPEGAAGVVFRAYTERGFQVVRLLPNRQEQAVLAGVSTERPLGMLRPSLAGGEADLAPSFPLTLEEAGYLGTSDTVPIRDQEPSVTGSPDAQKPLEPSGVEALEASKRPPSDEPSPETRKPDANDTRAESADPPAPSLPHPPGKRYFPATGIRLTGLAPELSSDEGAATTGFVGGTTLGLSGYWADPSFRHGLYLEAQQGLGSGHPSWFGLYQNEQLGIPLSVWAQEGAWVSDFLLTSGQAYRIWDRATGAGVSAQLPWTRGRLSVSLAYDLGGERYQRFYALDPALESGLRLRQGGSLRLGFSNSTGWRAPAQGHFISVSASRVDTWRTPLNDADPGLELGAGWTGRRHLANGTLDLTLRGGARLDLLDPLRGWGGAGALLIPGLGYQAAVEGFYLGVGRIELSQDLWRPEWVFGALPSLSFERLELLAAAGVGVGLKREGAWGESGSGLSAGLRGHFGALRDVIRITPQLQLGYNPATQEYTLAFTVEGLPIAAAKAQPGPRWEALPEWLRAYRPGAALTGMARSRLGLMHDP